MIKKFNEHFSNIWIYIIDEDDKTFPPEGEEVLVSDGKNYDVAYYLRSGEYIWKKVNIEMDRADDLTNFNIIKWRSIED